MIKQRPTIKVGDRLWNMHYGEVFCVTGETTRSWLVRRLSMASYEESLKVPKAALPEAWTASEKEWEDHRWCFTHRYWVASAVERACTPQQLRQIAEIIGYKDEKYAHAKDGVK